MQQVGQAVVLPTDHDDHPLAHVGVAQMPVQLQFLGHVGKAPAELVGPEGQAVGHDLDALEELAGGEVAVLGRLHHPASVGGDESGDRSHDSRPIRTGDGEDQAAHSTIIAPSSGYATPVGASATPAVHPNGFRTRDNAPRERRALSEKSRRRPTLPGGYPPSTIGAGGLNCRVRNGNGCLSAAMATGNRALTGARTAHRTDMRAPG